MGKCKCFSMGVGISMGMSKGWYLLVLGDCNRDRNENENGKLDGVGEEEGDLLGWKKVVKVCIRKK